MNDLNSQSHNINQLEMANLINDADPSADQTSRLENIDLNEDAANIEVKIVDPKEKRTAKPVAQQNTVQPRREVVDDEEEEEVVLKYGASHVVKLFVPVTICLIFVILSLSFVTSYTESGGATLVYTPFNEDSQSNSTKLWMSIVNALIFITVVIVMTIVLIILYKFKFYRVIHGWLAFSSLMLLFFFTYMYISELFKQFNIVTDMVTVILVLWNFGILGMFCIHWKGPLFLQQVFLIFSCIQMALIFIKYLPEWTTWVLLAFISIWDLVAVLCPFGPLRILVETAHSRNDNLFPAMVYSSTIMYSLINMADHVEPKKDETAVATDTVDPGPSRLYTIDSDDGGFIDTTGSHIPASLKVPKTSSSLRNRNSQNPNERTPTEAEALQQRLEAQKQDEEENGVKLGLGDFIFYSILVGKASILGDWNTVIACVVAILIGLCLTLVLLAVFHKPLPALPISLLFGLIFYFSTNLVVRPFYEALTFNQVFI